MSDKYPGGFVTANAPAGFSVAFDGTGDNLTLAPGAAFAFGTGDFTIEQWFYPSIAIPTYAYLIDARNSGQTANWATGFNLNNTGTGQFTFFDGVSATAYNEPSASYKQNAWNHCVVVRSGTTFSMFMNGVRVYTTTNSTNFSTSSTLSYIGRGQASGSEFYFTGYMSNVRVVKGTAVYSPSATTLTVPTQLFPITNTTLLTCQSPTLIDNSTNNLTITAVGNAAVSNFTPFAAYTGFNPALGAAAGGVWTLDEAAYYQNNRQWPIYDPYFNNTTLMLHGNGTNGAQNNTFLDSSTNNFTITRNGNTTQGSFSPFSQTGWSNYFGGGGSGLSFQDTTQSGATSNFDMGATQASWDFWAYVTSSASSGLAFVKSASGAASWNDIQYQFYLYDGSNVSFFFRNGANYALLQAPISTSLVNTWAHFAVSTDTAGNISIYINGIRGATTNNTIGKSSTANYIGVGCNIASTNGVVGYMTDVRFIKGANAFSATATTITVPNTAPATATAGVQLLTCQSNRFVDNSANKFTLTVGGTPSVQAFSPFVPAYITPTTYSNWFDGSGDYLTAPNAAWMNLGTGDFTMECWVQFNSVSSTQMFVSNNYDAGTGGGGWAFLYRQDNTTLKFTCNSNVSYEKTWSPAVGTMYHVAVCRSGTDLRLFVNGVQLGTTSTSTDNISGASSTLVVGTNLGGTPLPINGVISNMRIVTSALYTASFTPPTAPLTAVTNTQLLTCQSSTFIDNSANAATLTANGNTVPVTSPTPFPAKVDTTTLNSAYSTSLIGGSGYFDRSGDYLTSPSNAAFTFGTGDYTIECWFYTLVADGTAQSMWSTNWGASGALLMTYDHPLVGSKKFGLFDYTFNSGAPLLTSSSTFPINQWNHVVIARSGSTAKMFVNGSEQASATQNTNLTRDVFVVSSTSSSSAAEPSYGYISGLRVVKGTAVYTKAFASPLTPPTNISNTQLLLNYTNGAIFDNTAKNVLETVGNAQISTTQSKWGGGSMYFDGTGDYLTIRNNNLLQFGTGDFTFEAWIYPTNLQASKAAGEACVIDTGSSGFLISLWNNNVHLASYGVADLGDFSSTGIANNTWAHLVITRSGTSVRCFVNGTQAGSTATLSTNFSSSGSTYIGSFNNATSYYTGYIDDLRITKGVARYTANFTPPTSQLQDQ